MERMERSAQSPDLNPIQHLWDYSGRQVAALSPPTRSLVELQQKLPRAWSLLPTSLTDNLIGSSLASTYCS
ncbi:hypothetical protein X975_25079, partial [Stegodyphus mimosarum]